MRGTEVRELVQQISVWPNHIAGHFSVREHRKKDVSNVVSQRPAIVGKARRAARVIEKNVRQQLSSDPLCFLMRIPAGMFQFVREDGNETGVIHRLSVHVCLPLLSRQENRLQWSSTPVCLDPTRCRLLQCASPESY